MKPPAMTPVKSRNLQSIGYSNDGLFVRFNGGGLYQYPDAPRSVYEEGLKSESPGNWFRDAVRGKFEHKKYDA